MEIGASLATVPMEIPTGRKGQVHPREAPKVGGTRGAPHKEKDSSIPRGTGPLPRDLEAPEAYGIHCKAPDPRKGGPLPRDRVTSHQVQASLSWRLALLDSAVTIIRTMGRASASHRLLPSDHSGLQGLGANYWTRFMSIFLPVFILSLPTSFSPSLLSIC